MKRSQRRAFWHVVIWVVFLLVCLGAGGLELWQSHQQRVAEAAWNVRRVSFHKLDERREQQMRALYNGADLGAAITSMPVDAKPWLYDEIPNARERRPTIRQFEMLFNDDQPLKLVPVQKGLSRWTDPMTGRVLYMGIENGKWMRGCTEGYPPGPPCPAPTTFSQWTGQLPGGVAYMGPLIWLLLTLVFVVWHSRRKVLAEILLGLALLCTTESIVLTPFSAGRILRWDAPLLLISTALVIASCTWPYTPVVGEPLCENCGYNLTGNVSGVCPECGASITAAGKR